MKRKSRLVLAVPAVAPISTKPLRDMAEDIEAIWLLAESRSQLGIDAAIRMLDRISRNDAQACLMKLLNENREKPIMQQKYMP